MNSKSERVCEYEEPLNSISRVINKLRLMAYLCYGTAAGLDRHYEMDENDWDGLGMVFQDLAADLITMQKKLPEE